MGYVLMMVQITSAEGCKTHVLSLEPLKCLLGKFERCSTKNTVKCVHFACTTGRRIVRQFWSILFGMYYPISKISSIRRDQECIIIPLI
jgi:hypothetical protein